MTVLEVIKAAAENLQLKQVLERTEFGGSGEDGKQELETLIRALNMIVQDIAYAYLSLIEVEKLAAVNGEIEYASFSKPVIEVIKVSAADGSTLKFKSNTYGLSLVSGAADVTVKYAYAPEVLTELNDIVPNFGGKLSLDAISYGISAEFMFMNGILDDARMWEERFKQNLFNARKLRREVSLPKRRWT
ncbi:MAG: hypothetical protein FWE53_02895 [Firmicutes bacterium]|nr:hypothetical protein [Bacillota bacterium]